MKNVNVLITNDVETTSLLNHKLRDKTADFVLSQGMPRLLDLYDKYNVKATFFYTGHIAKLKPEVVKMAYERGHEIGSHGLSHQVEHAFDVLTFDEQIYHLTESKKRIEDIIGEEIISFRAPAARVQENTAKALIETGFLIDSSIASQRLDMFFSFGAIKKLKWLTAPRMPYQSDLNNIFKKGEKGVFEIPISAFGLPYIGTFMRIAPSLNQLTRHLLFLESKHLNQRPINFLTHPNEFIDEDWEEGKIKRRAKNIISYYLGDVLRHQLKIKNLGEKGLPLLENELIFFKNNQSKFITLKDYKQSIES